MPAGRIPNGRVVLLEKHCSTKATMKSNTVRDTGELLLANEASVQEILGYLNFSSGRPDRGFQRSFNRLCERIPERNRRRALRDALLSELDQQSGSSRAFADSRQADAVIRLAFDDVVPAYRRFHRDLLFHLEDRDFEYPFFLLRVLEAVLAQESPWDERERIVSGAIDHLNDFLGHRPLAVLENGRKMQPYPHERVRPIPLFIRQAGVSSGRYGELVARAIDLLEQTPADVLAEAYFDLARMDELALDVRAYDHENPVFRRTNYLFGEWDPHQIDNSGYYRRFVVRKIILDTLLDWIAGTDDEATRSERLYDASAVLAGTILMASAISGYGPGTFDSSVSLTTLLPGVARLRDEFYTRLQQTLRGPRADRLKQEAEHTQQPFGHVRQFLNIHIARYGARQVQNRRSARLFARMGFPDAGRQQAAKIPSVAARFETEIAWRIGTAIRHDTEPSAALAHGREIEELLHRGIDCGALVDPWNILGFQAQFPLFASREDSVPDERVDVLLGIVEDLFSIYARAMAEAAAQGDDALREAISTTFERFADEWDQYATTTVTDLPAVSGRESCESATNVARAVAGWQQAGAAAGDISFWRGHVEQFHSPKAYAQVVGILLDKRDHVAAMGLMMQWLSEADRIGLQSGPYPIDSMLLRWMDLVTGDDFVARPNADRWTSIRRLFDYLEANAGDLWSIANTARAIGRGAMPGSVDDPSDAGDDWLDEELLTANGNGIRDEDDDEDENDLFGAAYDNVTYRDSAADGGIGDLLDEADRTMESEIDSIVRDLEPRLQFFQTLAQLWQRAAARFAAEQLRPNAKPRSREVRQKAKLLIGWYRRVRQLQSELTQLLGAIANFEILPLADDPESNLRYDFEWQSKLYLVHKIIAAHTACRAVERLLVACLSRGQLADERPADSTAATDLYRGLLHGKTGTVRRLLPRVLAGLVRQPLLYVAPENGGDPRAVLTAKTAHSLFRFLLSELPRLGMLRETWQVLRAAFKIEHAGRPDGMVISEFDTLFRTALRGSLLCVIRSSEHWRAHRPITSPGPAVETTFCRPRSVCRVRSVPDVVGHRPPRRMPAHRQRRRANGLRRERGVHGRQRQSIAERRRAELLIGMVSRVAEPYLRLWFRHSRSVRLSATEAFSQDVVWTDVRHFVIDYGADLFHARMLSPVENIRAIVQQGVEPFLDYLVDNPDPLHPMRLVEDMESGAISREKAIRILTIIYESLLEKIDRFVEYNTTTTQSDYGDRFYCLLDFLRLEASYERDAWNMIPAAIVHDLLTSRGQDQAARIWERNFTRKTADIADRHLKSLERLEKLHGMRLPSLTDRLNERFVKPLAIDRMKALVPRAVDDARRGRHASRAFRRLRREIDAYAGWMSGSAHDLPAWLRAMEEEVDRLETGSARPDDEHGFPAVLPEHALTPDQIRGQLALWNKPLSRRRVPKSR